MPDHVHLLLKPFPKQTSSSNASILLADSDQDRFLLADSDQDRFLLANSNQDRILLANSNQDRFLPPDSSNQQSSLEYWSIGSILHSIKSYSAKQIPTAMNHIGKVWQDGRYDRLVRDRKEFDNTWKYIKQNPVKAGLCKTPEEYQFFWEIQ